MHAPTTPRVDLSGAGLGAALLTGPDAALFGCSRSGVALVRQLARQVRARCGALGTPSRSLVALIADGRAFTEFVAEHFGLRKLSNVKPKHVRAWLESLQARGTARLEVERRGASLAALGLLRPKHVRRIVSGLTPGGSAAGS